MGWPSSLSLHVLQSTAPRGEAGLCSSWQLTLIIGALWDITKVSSYFYNCVFWHREENCRRQTNLSCVMICYCETSHQRVFFLRKRGILTSLQLANSRRTVFLILRNPSAIIPRSSSYLHRVDCDGQSRVSPGHVLLLGRVGQLDLLLVGQVDAVDAQHHHHHQRRDAHDNDHGSSARDAWGSKGRSRVASYVGCVSARRREEHQQTHGSVWQVANEAALHLNCF